MKKLIIVAVLFSAQLAYAQVCSTPAQLDTDMTAGTVGQVISLSGINPINCSEVSMTETWSGGKLIFSDSPESPTATGKLYEDVLLPATSGTNYHRIYLYHTNGRAAGGSKMRFVVLIKNISASSATLQVQKKGTAGPTLSYAYAGKLAYQRWTDSTAATAVTVTAGSTVRLDSTFDATSAAAGGYLMHGIWDYSMNQQHQVTVCAINETDNPLTVCPGLSVLARDSHDRGTFPNSDKVYDTASGETIDTNEGVQSFPIAGNTTNDTNASGTDATDGTAMTLHGNYGVLYRMHLTTAASDSQNLGILVNPRGGSWGGASRIMAGLLPTVNTTALLPSGTGTTSDNTKGTVVGRYSPGTSLSVWNQFMPTGGSSFPVRFVLVPH